MKEKIILIGGGGHCKSCIDVIEQEGKYQIEGILDLPELVGKDIMGYKVIGTDKDLPSLCHHFKNYHITIGQIKSPRKRIELAEQVEKLGGRFPVIVSPYAIVSKHSKIGMGTIIMHHAVINAEAVIGNHCIINTKALVEHEAQIGNYCHISTAACINGQVIIGDKCFIGSNASIANNITIFEDTIIAAGTTVYKSIQRKGTYIGFPLRKIN